MLLYYLYRQYPSGGDYETTSTVAPIVVIQSHDPIKANFFAQTKGIYFDGIAKGLDCTCCDDRWTALSEDSKGHPKPNLGKMELITYLKDWIDTGMMTGSPSRILAYIYYADGMKEPITIGEIVNRYHFFRFQQPD
jgi:hypothetical protein